MMARTHSEAEKEAHPGSWIWTPWVLSRAEFKEARLLPGPAWWKQCDCPYFEEEITETQSPPSLRSLQPQAPIQPVSAPPCHPGGDRGRVQLFPGLPNWAAVPEPSQSLPWPRAGPRCPCLHVPAVLLLCWLAEGEPPGTRPSCGRDQSGHGHQEGSVSRVDSMLSGLSISLHTK